MLSSSIELYQQLSDAVLEMEEAQTVILAEDIVKPLLAASWIRSWAGTTSSSRPWTCC